MKYFLAFFIAAISAFNLQSKAQSSWFQLLSGSIDKYPVTMYLHKAGHSYSGFYYYNAVQRPLYISGSDTTGRNVIELFAYAPGEDDDETFKINNEGQQLWSGTWTKEKKSLHFSAAALDNKDLDDFFYVYTEGTTLLNSKLKDGPSAHYYAASVWPKGNTDKDVFISTQINKILGGKDEEEPGAFFLRSKKEYFKTYKNDYNDVSEDDLKNNTPMYSQDDISSLNIIYQTKDVLSLAHASYSYTGGAHGNYGTGYYVLDLHNKKLLQTEDVFTADALPFLKDTLEKYFRIDYHVKDGESLQDAGLFDDSIPVNNNFFVTEKGICFSYAPYEIGPYAMGQVEIFIPFSGIIDDLKPYFRQLVKP